MVYHHAFVLLVELAVELELFELAVELLDSVLHYFAYLAELFSAVDAHRLFRRAKLDHNVLPIALLEFRGNKRLLVLFRAKKDPKAGYLVLLVPRKPMKPCFILATALSIPSAFPLV